MYSSPSGGSNARRTRPPPVDFYDEDIPPPPPPPIALEDMIRMDASTILQGLSQIRIPSVVYPVVCLEEHTFPLFLGDFTLGEQADTGILLPICAFSHMGKEKYVFFGGINFLHHSVLESTETSAFIENSITWASGYKVNTIKVLLLQIPSQISNTLITDLHGFGYHTESVEKLPQSMSHDVIFSVFPTEFDVQLMNLAKTGISVFFFFHENSSIYPSPEISRIGVSFPPCSLRVNSRSVMGSPYNVLQSSTLKSSVIEYLDALKNYQTIDTAQLDNIVSKLRYHISEVSSSNADTLVELQKESLKFLESTNYRDGNGICPTLLHGMISVVLTELIQKLPPKFTTPAPAIETFPGVSEDYTLKDFLLHMDLKNDSWNRTGLWLPAGVIATVKSSQRIKLQIGSHTCCMLLRAGPWMRWPTVVTYYTISPNCETEIATQFGGIVYILSSQNVSIDVVFKGFCQYPFFDLQNPLIWDNTKDLSIPWSEAENDHVILTMPSKYLKMVSKLPKYMERLDLVLSHAYSFFGIQTPLKRRVIFDIDLPTGDPICGDIVFMDMNTLHDVTCTSQITNGFVQLLICICRCLIVDMFSDPTVESAIATCAVRFAIKSINYDFPEDMLLDAPRLFQPLWAVLLDYGEKCFSSALTKMAFQPDETSPENSWRMFVNYLSQEAGTDLTRTIEQNIRLGTILGTSSERLQVYQMSDNDL